ncbi:hypothetical protein OX284_011555 [Flavobacterium sp. SUN046]|uniref:hypothetical protein n=1 Tax=Flavobacterium sp. SUN046 TaxID=3002440 RepID=UPI002DBF8D73|nr:hypothetical protein [Flavobacterium sp. SUN046]MEC4050068.1 hypothetical protein [Flavobacterium sp. SUN046]
MHIGEQIYLEHNIKLPIKGDYGSTIEKCVIILAEAKYNFIEVQNTYIDCCWGKGNWKKVKQSLIIRDDKKYDKITIDVSGVPIEYYFDITECY